MALRALHLLGALTLAPVAATAAMAATNRESPARASSPSAAATIHPAATGDAAAAAHLADGPRSSTSPMRPSTSPASEAINTTAHSSTAPALPSTGPAGEASSAATDATSPSSGPAPMRLGREAGGDATRLRTSEQRAGSLSTTTLALFALIAIGALAWWKRRKLPVATPEESIELLAQSSLGGRARAMWLRAGERDIVVAVTAQAVQVLAAWPNASRAADLADAPAPGLADAPARSLANTDPSTPATAPHPSASSLHPRRPIARVALRAARPSGARCRPSYRRRGDEDPQ